MYIYITQCKYILYNVYIFKNVNTHAFHYVYVYHDQHVLVRIYMAKTATHCNTLQHTATHCNTLQHTATHCNTLSVFTWHTGWGLTYVYIYIVFASDICDLTCMYMKKLTKYANVYMYSDKPAGRENSKTGVK